MSTTEYPAPRLGGPRVMRLRAAEALRAVPVDIWLTLTLLVLAAAIRIAVIDNQSFWMDEALTGYETRLPFGAMINTVLHVETTPPLYFVLIWLWAHLFGSGEVALRLVSTLAGIALVPIAYLSAKELVSRSAGVVAAALVALNPFLIWYSQEARAYMLLAALSGASFLWFVRAWREPTARAVAWWAACSALAVMTHFFAGFAVAPEALWLLWRARGRVTVVAACAVAAVQVAMASFALLDTSHGAGWIARIPRLDRVSQAIAEWAVSIMYRRAAIADGLLGGAVLLALLLLLLTFGGERRIRRGAGLAAIIVGFVWLVPLALGYLGQDYFLSRNLIPSVVPLATVLGAACVAPRTRFLGGALALALLATFGFAAARVQTHPYLERPNWRAVAHALGAATAPRAILAADGTNANPLKLYMPRVAWAQPPTREVVIREVDVVGATKRLPSIRAARTGSRPLRGRRHHLAEASPVPRSVDRVGATLISRFSVENWVLARFVLHPPMRVDVKRLIALAPRYFRFAPVNLLVFFQGPGR